MTPASDFGSVIFGLLSAATFGVGDFSGGLANRRTPTLSVLVISQSVGLALLIALALLSGEPTPAPADVFWGAAAGAVGLVGLFSLYRAMALGQMGIAAPITAVLSAAIPVIVGTLAQGLPNLLHLAGFGLALAGVWLMSRPQTGGGRPAGVGLALLGGLGFGGFLVLIAQVHQNAVFWPLVAARVTSLTIMIGVVLRRRKFAVPVRAALPLIMTAGVMDVGGNAFFVLAEQAGRLDVASVLSSLYPATTVLLALLILKERLTRIQGVGVLLALAAIPMIAAR